MSAPTAPEPSSLPGITVDLDGDELYYVDAGRGPAMLFIHGLLCSSRSWEHLVGELAADFRVIAPDLFGHGSSAKPVGDYSLGGHAGVLRDLLDRLGVEKVAIVGHSLGGGIAMEFAYLFPERVERLVLVSSGGLGRELNPLLRAPTLPGAEWVMPLVASRWVRERGAGLARTLLQAGLRSSHDVNEAWNGFVSLGDAESRRAFLATARAVIDPGGQTIQAGPRLARMTVPTLLVWGARDRLIPYRHAVAAHQLIKGSRLEIFEDAGHFPHLDDPERFARVLRDFVGLKGAA